jgi:hypothetical protein
MIRYKMRTLLITSALLAQLVVSKVLPVEPPLNFTSPDSFELSAAARRNLVARQNTPPPEDDPEWEDPYDKMWNDALCRGERLLHAMTLGELDAAWTLGWPYLQSPWDGDLQNELEKWGWLDTDENHENADYFCNFEEEMGNLFKGLSIDGRSAQMGDPNHCFYIEHKNGRAVKKNKDGSLPVEADQKYDADGKEYRVRRPKICSSLEAFNVLTPPQVTGAYSRVGINREDGIVYFLHRRSPEKGAEILWELPEYTKPDPAALPKLRSSSDLAFGLWNRVPAPNGQKIEKFMSVNIVNEDAEEIIRRALEKVDVDGVQGWPGTDFDMTSDGGRALLGEFDVHGYL